MFFFDRLGEWLMRYQLFIDGANVLLTLCALYLKQQKKRQGWLLHFPKKLLNIVSYGFYRKKYIKLAFDLCLFIPLLLLGYRRWGGQPADKKSAAPASNQKERTSLFLVASLLLGGVVLHQLIFFLGFSATFLETQYVVWIAGAYFLLGKKVSTGWLLAIVAHGVFILDLMLKNKGLQLLLEAPTRAGFGDILALKYLAYIFFSAYSYTIWEKKNNK